MILRRIIEIIKQIIWSRLQKIVYLFCSIFKLELEQDISEVCATFQCVSIVWFRGFRTESQAPLFTKFGKNWMVKTEPNKKGLS